MRPRLVIGLGLGALVLLAACTSEGGSSSAGGSGAIATVNGGRAPAVAASPAPDFAAGAAGGQKNDAGQGSAQQAAILDPRALIRTADLHVEVRAGTPVGAQADRAEDITQAAGGQVYGDERSSDGHGSAALTLKLPPEQLAGTLARLAALGKELSRDLSTQDVTSQVADVSSRVSSAQEAIARLRTLYASATKVADVIEVEQELSSRESDLEALEAQQRALSAQTSLATIHLTLTGAAPVPVTRHHSDHTGVGAALAAGWRAFVTAARSVAVAFAAALPFLVVVAMLAALGLIAVRRRASARPQPEPEPSSS